jgi:CheY-like chemotaxis protein/signal transduction histidine kinase
MSQNAVSASFIHELRRALNHLYDWAELSKSPLLSLFDVEQQEDPPSALRRILTDAIQALKPSANVLPRARAWRTHQLLHSRFIEQSTQKEAAAELALSVRHLRRAETMALEVLAAYLSNNYSLAPKWQDQIHGTPDAEDVTVSADVQQSSREQELRWLQASLPREPVDVQELIRAGSELTHSLAQVLGVAIDLAVPQDMPRVIVQLIPMRQAFASVFASACHSAPGGQVTVKAQVERSGISIGIRANARFVAGIHDYGVESLRMAQQLAKLSGGSLEVAIDEERKRSLTFTMTLPAEEQIPVLVIDDNADTLLLLRRYLSNTRYRFIGTSDPQQALRLAQESTPRIILLDVMLPSIDGWELLGRLHEHPQTRDIPVVVCTILPQKDLASDLGAAAFLRKPVSRSALLLTLDHQLGLQSTGSC